MLRSTLRQAASLALLASLALASTPAVFAQQRSGHTAVEDGYGFGCKTGTSWTMDNGVARCKLPIATTVPEAPCAAVNNFAPLSACRFDLPAVGSGVTATAPNKTSGYIGSTTLTCTNGSWGAASTTCIPIPKLTVTPGASSILLGDSTTFSWSASDATSVSYSCSGANPSSGSLPVSGSRTLSGNSVGSTSCTATASGPGGTSPTAAWSFYTSAPAGCSATTFTSGSCTYSIPAMSSGGSATGSNTTSGFSGSVQANCFNGSVNVSSPTCTANPAPPPPPPPPPPPSPPPAPPATVCSMSNYSPAWGAGCGTTINDVLADGATGTYNNTNVGYAGALSYTCTAGSLSVASQSCSASAAPPPAPPAPPANCAIAGFPASWGGGCGTTINTVLTHGQAGGFNSTTAGFVGMKGYLCNNGSLVPSGSEVCAATPPPAPPCPSTQTTSGSCVFNITTMTDGQSSVFSAVSGGIGSLMATCSAGAWLFTNRSCDSNQRPPTPACPSGASFNGSVCVAPWAYLVLNGSSMGLIDSRALPGVSMLPPDLEALISGTTLSAINSAVSTSTAACTAEVNRMMAAGELSPQTSGGVSGSTAGLSWSCSIGMDSATMMASWHVLITP